VKQWALDVRLTETGAAQVALRPADRPGEEADLSLSGQIENMSAAYRNSLLDPAHRRALALLAHDLEALASARITAPLDAAAARMLLIHRWRRIVLRYADVHPDLMPLDAPLADPRAQVAAAYRRLVPAAEAWLASGENDLRPMPPAAAGFSRRFETRERA
jgi:phenylacetic acid degradation operon negative regulatory protein